MYNCESIASSSTTSNDTSGMLDQPPASTSRHRIRPPYHSYPSLPSRWTRSLPKKVPIGYRFDRQLKQWIYIGPGTPFDPTARVVASTPPLKTPPKRGVRRTSEDPEPSPRAMKRVRPSPGTLHQIGEGMHVWRMDVARGRQEDAGEDTEVEDEQEQGRGEPRALRRGESLTLPPQFERLRISDRALSRASSLGEVRQQFSDMQLVAQRSVREEGE